MEEIKKILCDLLDSVSDQQKSVEGKVSEMSSMNDVRLTDLENRLNQRIGELEEKCRLLDRRLEMLAEENKSLHSLNEDLAQRINDLYDVYADRNILSEEEPLDLADDSEVDGADADVDEKTPVDVDTELSGQQAEGAEVFRLMQEMERDEESVDEQLAKMDPSLFVEEEPEEPEEPEAGLFDGQFTQPEEPEEPVASAENAETTEPEVNVEPEEANEVEEVAEQPVEEAETEAVRIPEEGEEEIECSLFDTLIQNDEGQRPLWITENPGPAVSKITHGITINDKIMYINELFNGDSVLYKRTMSLLEDFPTFGEAYTFLREQFPDWDESSKPVYSFYMTVRRKLRS